MAAFSYQYTPFLVDSVLMPNTPIKNQGLLDEFFPNLNQICPLSGNLQQEGSSIDGSVHGSSCFEPSVVTEKQRSESLVSSMVDVTESGEQVTQNLAKKRRGRNGFSSDSANSKDVKQVKCKKQNAEKEAKKDVKNDKKLDKNEATEEPPKGYIHVRARRGQATDSHSLAERVRREKINERMKMLQALVPGCDKVTGKALMLDEIINYVQSLQNQVEFLSLKLASLDPMVYTFGLMDMDPMAFGAEGMSNSMALPPPPLMQSTTTSATTSGIAKPFSDTNAISSSTASPAATTATNSFPSNLVDTSASLLQQEQKQTVLPIQEGRSSYWGLLDDQQRQQSFINQFGFDTNNLYSLQ